MHKLVSIVTPSYNSEKFISETINSVISQTYKNWEMIIVDDVSTDNSLQIINSFIEKDNRIKLHKLSKNSGPGIARNKGIEVAKGSFIAFLDTDDLWVSVKLEHQVKFMTKNSYALTYTSYKTIDENSKDINKPVYSKSKLNYKDMLYSNKIGCLTAMYNTEVLGKVFMPEIRKRQDYGLWLKILKKIEFAYGLSGFYALYRDRSNSISNNKLEMLKWNFNLYKKVENFSYLKSLYYTFSNVLNKLFS